MAELEISQRQRYFAELRAWRRRVRRYSERASWFWLLVNLLEDRVMEWANGRIDSAASSVTSSGFVEYVKWALVTFDGVGFGIFWNIVALTILGILILAYWNTWQDGKRVLLPLPLPLQNITDQESADRENIDDIFRTHGALASEKIRKIAEDLCEQLHRSNDEGKKILARLARNFLSNGCSSAHHSLIRALSDKASNSLVLQERLGDFFLSYHVLVYWVHEIGPLSERQILKGKDYILWQEYHKMFLGDMRRLYGEGEFSALEKRIAEGQRGLTE